MSNEEFKKDSAEKYVEESRLNMAAELRRMLTIAENKQVELQQVQQQIRGLEQQIERCDNILKRNSPT